MLIIEVIYYDKGQVELECLLVKAYLREERMPYSCWTLEQNKALKLHAGHSNYKMHHDCDRGLVDFESCACLGL